MGAEVLGARDEASDVSGRGGGEIIIQNEGNRDLVTRVWW